MKTNFQNVVEATGKNFEIEQSFTACEYFTAFQFIEIGSYAHGIITIEQLASSLKKPQEIVKQCAENCRLRIRVVHGNDYQVSKALDDFANELAANK